MTWPFVSKARYQEMTAFKDQRIAELEEERRMLWDKVCLLGIGAPAFAPIIQEQAAQKDAEDTSTTAPAGIPAVSMRPSAIMRRMERLAEARWLKKGSR